MKNKTALEKLIERHEEGVAVLIELFKLSDGEIKEKVKNVVDIKHHKFIDDSSMIQRIIVDEIPTSIEIMHWCKISINSTGIVYESEHGYVREDLTSTLKGML